MIARIAALSATLALSSQAANWMDYYDLAGIPNPPGRDVQVGGLTAMQDGRIALALHRGEIMIYDPETKAWTEFATGLHEPLGLIEDSPGVFALVQRAELTRVSDTNQDGIADFYETLSDDFGMTGNYHEFSFGPVKDSDGNYYISLNVASNGAGIRKEVRGDWSPIGMEREKMADLANWGKLKGGAGRMYARVPYRGWILKVTPEGKTIPWALGFRSPNGMAFDSEGRMYVTDNQGDWLGTSPLYHVEKDNFYGHPASLLWKEGWDRDPLKVPVTELDAMRTPPAARFPQGELANSPTQPVRTISPEKFGLPEGELIVADMSLFTLSRFLPDEVDGVVQGALIPFIEGSKKDIGNGNNRLDFDESGRLWLGKTRLNWAGSMGIKNLTFKGKAPFLIDQVKASPAGLELHFNKGFGGKTPTVEITSHSYHYHSAYGSKKVNLIAEPVIVTVDGQTLTLGLDPLKSEHLYTIKLTDIATKEGETLLGDVIYYNVARKP